MSSPVIHANIARAIKDDEVFVWEWQGVPADSDEHMQWLMLRWRVDPIAFSVEALRTTLLPYQVQILLDLADAPLALYEFYEADPNFPKRQVLTPSGHGLGKTRVLAIAIWWHTLTHPFSKRIVTAPTSDQLTGQLWGEIRKLKRRLTSNWPDISNDWEVLNSSIVHINPEYSDWSTLARTARPEKPEGLQGAHALDDDDEFGDLANLFQEQVDNMPSGGIMVIAEEASGIDDSIREVLEGALSEEGARFLAPGNPTRAEGWFARDIDRTDRYAVHCLDCRMSNRDIVYTQKYRDFGGNVHQLRIRGRVRPAYWEEIIKECDGDESADRVRVRVRGMKPQSSTQQVISSRHVDEAMDRVLDEKSKNMPVVLGLDFGLTTDFHGLSARQGFNIRDVIEWLIKDRPDDVTMEAARRAIDWQEMYGAKYIIGDANGVGRGAMEYLSAYFNSPEHKHLGVIVIHFNSGKGALDSKRYGRRRDEMWYKHGRAFFANQRTHCPNIPKLKGELTAPGYYEDTNNKIFVESKKDLFKRTGKQSGNMADSLLQTLVVNVLRETPKKEKVETHPKVFREHFARYKAKQNADSGEFIR